jgi:hypothetical protein
MNARRLLPLLVLPLGLAACRQAKIETYVIPKEQDPGMPAAAGQPGSPDARDTGSATPAGSGSGGMADATVPTASGPGLTWTAPSEWKVKTGSAMRKGSYAVPGDGGADADLSITAFPGDVGGELANVNRWRGQVQLPPLTDADLGGGVTRMEQNGLKITLVDAAGGSQRILGAIIPYGDGVWFLKLMGPEAVVTRARPAFLAFLKTVKPAAP